MESGATASPVIDMGDLMPYASARRIAGLAEEERALAVTWDDGHESRYHYMWLRDNCACTACRHPDTLERRFEIVDVPDDLRPAHAEVTDAGALRLVWPATSADPEGHESLYDPGWLRRHCYAEASRAARRARVTTWGTELTGNVPTVEHTDLMTGEVGLRRWLTALTEQGVALLRNGPTADREVLRVAERVGPPRGTNFGLHFDVQSKPKPNNSAYTAAGLAPHADLPNWRRAPDFQLLYCLANEAEGGESILVDGFRVAEVLRETDPESFEVLTTVPVDFRFQDAGSDIRFRSPAIVLGPDGELSEIRFNNWIRDTLDAPDSRMDALYRAYRAFWRMLRDPAYQVRLRLDAGQMVAFDNLRILHGREGFDPSTGFRHLQGTYLDRDLVESRLRVLERGG